MNKSEEEKNFEENAKKMPKIDMSKIANIDALDSSEKDFVKAASKNINVSARRDAKKKFSFNEPLPFNLPSRGKYYQDSEDPDIRKGTIMLVPMSVADEEILTNKAYQKNGSMFRVLFDTCMASNYPAEKLLQFDVMYIMYLLRQISYGDDYKFNVHCDECDKDFEYTMNVSDIAWKELPDDEPDVRDIKLPRSGYTVTMPLPRLGMDEDQEMIKRQNADNDMATDMVTLFVSRTISIRDPNGNEVPPSDWIEFFHELPTIDRNAINNSFKNADNNPKVSIVCPKCGNIIKMAVPIDTDFFRTE